MPIPRTNDILDKLGTAKYFTSVDMFKGFWQVPVRDEDIEKTAFITPSGLYEWLHMPMGRMNSGATFQAMMEEALAPLLWQCVVVYIDDVFIFSNSFEEHLEHLDQVFDLLEKAGLKTRPDKTSICKTSVKVLGFIIDEEGIKPQENKVKKILEAPVEKSKKGIMSFMGLVRYYERFIQGLSAMAKPLYLLLKKDADPSRDWGSEQDLAVEKLKEAFSSDLVLTKFDPPLPVLVQTDASNFALGAIISHFEIINGKRIERPILFASKTLNKHQLNYSVTEKECLAVVWAMDQFRTMLLGKRFTLETDH